MIKMNKDEENISDEQSPENNKENKIISLPISK